MVQTWGDIVLRPLPMDLEGAEVVGEAVPLQISGDTVVYNAAAFKTKPECCHGRFIEEIARG